MHITKKTLLFIALVFLIVLAACAPTATDPIAPEPTNTAVPESAEVVVQTTDLAVLTDTLNQLNEGGYVLYVRHTHTDRSRNDTDVRFGQCDQQRVLSEQGQEEALMIRTAYKQLALPVDLLISTQYCRTLETAVLAFGVPHVISRGDLSASLTQLLATQPPAGTNTIIVAHIGTLQNAIGLDDVFEEGDTLIYRPNGDGTFEFAGRIGLNDWPVLAGLK